MKKARLSTILLLVVTLLCSIFIFASCGTDEECDHQWSEWSAKTTATCTKTGTKEHKCSECGETEISTIAALGHNWADATCTTPKTCQTCSATEGSPLAHAYTIETVNSAALKSAATCTSAPVYYKSCSCGAIATSDADTFQNGAPLEHKDDNVDHNCDYGCGTLFGACEDSNKDHSCDYGCGALFGTCEDSNKDHDCDYGCEKTFGECSDSATDSDHICDYSCGAILENCSDANGDGDHNCDICGAAGASDHNYSSWIDEIAAVCGKLLGCFQLSQSLINASDFSKSVTHKEM